MVIARCASIPHKKGYEMKKILMLMLLIATFNNQYGALFSKIRLVAPLRLLAQPMSLRIKPVWHIPRCSFSATYGESWIKKEMFDLMPDVKKVSALDNVFTKQRWTECLLEQHMKDMNDFIGSYLNFPQKLLRTDYQRVVNRVIYWQSKKNQFLNAAKTIARTIEPEKEVHKNYEKLEKGFAELKKLIPADQISEMECRALGSMPHAARDQEAFLEYSSVVHNK